MTDNSTATEGPAGSGTLKGETGGDGTEGKKAPLPHDSNLVQGLYAIVLLVVLLATLQLYFAIQDLVNRWFSFEYIPIFNSMYFILVISAGVSLIWLRITRR